MKNICLLLLMVTLSAAGIYAQGINKTTELDRYLGVYSSNDVPLKFTLTKDNTVLILQGSGQQPLRLEATGKDAFKCDAMGLVIVFDPARQEFTLKQSGGTYHYTRDKIQLAEPPYNGDLN